MKSLLGIFFKIFLLSCAEKNGPNFCNPPPEVLPSGRNPSRDPPLIVRREGHTSVFILAIETSHSSRSQMLQRIFLSLLLGRLTLAEEFSNFEDISFEKDTSMEKFMEATTTTASFTPTFSTYPPISVEPPEPITPAKSFAPKPVVSEEKTGQLRFLPEEEKSLGYNMKRQKPVTPPVSRDEEGGRQVVAGVPDMSDPCFRRYSNAIVVNAQPYERRSSTSLMKCKMHCLNSQTGVYSCRSFVYDNINQVCDLFAHVGDQAPARLLKFQTRDYFEPTSAVQCLNINEPPHPEVAARASNIDERSIEKVKVNDNDLLEQKTSALDELIGLRCPAGKKTGFLRTQGFELFENDDAIKATGDIDECIRLCEKNNIDGQQLDCRSFDRIEGECRFTKEAAVPVGEGQLKQRQGAYYYERICVTEKISRNCPISFNRFPQMILVGFAESVSDSPSFEHCFDSCLNSFELFGFNCTSGMYYFEESQLNCILNSEDRHSQSDLFTDEDTDIVDYFEVTCERGPPVRAAGVKTMKDMAAIKSDKLVIASETQTAWSDCEEGVQHRRRDCGHGKECGMESRPCKQKPKKLGKIEEKLPSKGEVAMVKAKLMKNGFHCPADKCCKVFESCAVGLMKSSATGRLQWCKKPCEEMMKRRRRLLR